MLKTATKQNKNKHENHVLFVAHFFSDVIAVGGSSCAEELLLHKNMVACLFCVRCRRNLRRAVSYLTSCWHMRSSVADAAQLDCSVLFIWC